MGRGSVRQIDILVNNAGIFLDHPPLSTAFDEWNATWLHTLAANLLGPANLSLLAAQAMAARPSAGDSWGRGRIVNISSRGAFRGEPDAPAYGASKAGLNSLSQSMAKALAPRGVYVYCLAPGFVETDMAAQLLEGPTGPDILAQHPLGRISMPDEVAATAAFCALDAGRGDDRLHHRCERSELPADVMIWTKARSAAAMNRFTDPPLPRPAGQEPAPQRPAPPIPPAVGFDCSLPMNRRRSLNWGGTRRRISSSWSTMRAAVSRAPSATLAFRRINSKGTSPGTSGRWAWRGAWPRRSMRR